MGIVVETGAGVTLVEKGDRVVMPFNVSSGEIFRFLDQACENPGCVGMLTCVQVADGRCQNCEEGRTAFCTG
jgi:threonine dehydrogenase-like Zn-dependent dehydrogenase